jgi:hypothetical protein
LSQASRRRDTWCRHPTCRTYYQLGGREVSGSLL